MLDTKIKSFIEFINENNKDTKEAQPSFYPKGVYIDLKLTESSYNELSKYINDISSKIQNIKPNTDLHCTLIYSKKEHNEEIKPQEYQCTAIPKTLSLFGENKDTLVLELNSDCLKQRNKYLMDKYNFISDFKEYKPHITLAYECSNIDVNGIELPNFIIELENETIQELNENWLEDNKEKDKNE